MFCLGADSADHLASSYRPASVWNVRPDKKPAPKRFVYIVAMRPTRRYSDALSSHDRLVHVRHLSADDAPLPSLVAAITLTD